MIQWRGFRTYITSNHFSLFRYFGVSRVFFLFSVRFFPAIFLIFAFLTKWKLWNTIWTYFIAKCAQWNSRARKMEETNKTSFISTEQNKKKFCSRSFVSIRRFSHLTLSTPLWRQWNRFRNATRKWRRKMISTEIHFIKMKSKTNRAAIGNYAVLDEAQKIIWMSCARRQRPSWL